MSRRLGAVQYKGDEGFKKVRGRRGIVFIKDFYNVTGDHIDLWNGWRLSSALSPLAVYFSIRSDYTKGSIWFWEMA
ncbi:type VI secretion system amidase effector protein Tae4 [Schlegelella sp. S2-27]|uniref:Type VI secretion system amidase effector protein Tae4 n=1 Tax=Caldimonas mangrovi TaxID=2944811 RepID=A0ABT0YMU8_9BURK|nr:T6SS effector amidase Tae4 family protein [Caldimonas mangrovi]MCM5679577.1 type VI secretion system amidase effector protein Tae4 [Caldimonas mangrovi]